MSKRDYINLASKILAFVVNLGVSFFLTSYIVQAVSAEAYGFVGLANDFISYAQVFSIALNSMAARFVALELEKSNNLRVNEYMSSLIIMNFSIASLFALVGGLVIANLPYLVQISPDLVADVQMLWVLLFANFLVTLIGVAFGVAAFCRNRLDLEALRSIESTLLRAGVLIIAYFCFPATVWYVGLATLLAGVYVLLFNIRYTKRLMPRFKFRLKFFSWERILELLRSGMWNSITQLGVILRSGLDLLLANLFVGAQYMGLLSIAKVLPKQIMNLFSVMASVFAPRLVISYAGNDLDEMRTQLIRSMRLMSLFSSVPLVVLIVLGRDFFALWMPNQNADFLQMLTLIACSPYVILLPLEPLWNVFMAMNRLRVTSIYLCVESFVAIALTLLLLPHVSPGNDQLVVIVGVSALLEIVRSIFFLPLYACHCLMMRALFIYKIILKNIVATTLMCVSLALIKNMIVVDDWISFFGFAGFVLVVTLLIDYCFLLNRDNRRFIVTKIRALFGGGR